MASYKPQTPIARPVVVNLKAHNICFCIAILLLQFGSRFDFGLMFQVLIITIFVLILYSLSAARMRRSFLQLLWLLYVCLVWNDRNNRLFNNSHTLNVELIEKVKFHSYRWLKANNAAFVYGSQQW